MSVCQICGRAVKSKNGVIAHHGFKRPGQGWQTASCYGAKYRPYEVAKDALENYLPEVKKWMKIKQESLNSLLDCPPDKLDAVIKLDASGKMKSVVYTKPDNFDKNDNQHYVQPHSYAGEYRSKVRHLRIQIAEMVQDIGYLTQRIADWKGEA